MERESISLNEIDEMMNDYDAYSKYNYIPTKSDDFSNKNDRLSRSLYSKHSRDEGEIENDNVIDDNSFSRNKRKKVSEEKYSQIISKNESEESQVIDSKEENDSNMKNSSTNCGANEIEKKKISERGKGKDNFSIKLFKALNDLVCQKIKNSGIKIHKPDYKIFTHNTNLVDIYILLDIRYKNILIMNAKDKIAFNKFKELKLKISYKKKSCPLTEQSKEYKDAIRLLFNYRKIKKGQIINALKIKHLIIQFLKEKGHKNINEDDLYKRDKDNISLILKEEGNKKSREFQTKNKIILKDKDNKECNKILRELILEFFNSPKEFGIFSQKVKEINDNFKKEKKNRYSLLDNCEYNGFIKMVEEDCNLDIEQKKEIEKFTNHFLDRPLNEEEINKYIKNG